MSLQSNFQYYEHFLVIQTWVFVQRGPCSTGQAFGLWMDWWLLLAVTSIGGFPHLPGHAEDSKS